MVFGSGRTWPQDFLFFVGFFSESPFSSKASSASILISGVGEASSAGVTVVISKSAEANRATGSATMVADKAGDEGTGLLYSMMDDDVPRLRDVRVVLASWAEGIVGTLRRCAVGCSGGGGVWSKMSTETRGRGEG